MICHWFGRSETLRILHWKNIVIQSYYHCLTLQSNRSILPSWLSRGHRIPVISNRNCNMKLKTHIFYKRNHFYHLSTKVLNNISRSNTFKKLIINSFEIAFKKMLRIIHKLCHWTAVFKWIQHEIYQQWR